MEKFQIFVENKRDSMMFLTEDEKTMFGRRVNEAAQLQYLKRQK